MEEKNTRVDFKTIFSNQFTFSPLDGEGEQRNCEVTCLLKGKLVAQPDEQKDKCSFL